jgi:hypothetical protein
VLAGAHTHSTALTNSDQVKILADFSRDLAYDNSIEPGRGVMGKIVACPAKIGNLGKKRAKKSAH